MAYCPSCGNELGDDDRFCSVCGEAIDAVGFAPDTETETVHEAHGRTRRSEGEALGRIDRSEGEARGRIDRSESDLEFAFTYPFENGVGDLLKVGIALFFSVLVVPGFIALGYLYRLGNGAAVGDPDQPAFESWEALTKEGFFFALTYVLFVIGAFFIWFLPATAIVEVTSNRTITGAYGLLSWAVFTYVFPAVLTMFVATGRLRDAGSPSRIVEFAFSGTYLKAWLVYLVLATILSVLITLSAVTIVGVYFAVALTGMVLASYWGHVYYRWDAPGT